MTDLGTQRTRTDRIDVPDTEYDPDVTWRYLTPTDDPDGYGVEAELTQVADRAMRVRWDNCHDCEWNPTIEHPKVGDTVRHIYDSIEAERDYATVQTGYATDQGHGRVHFLIPLPRPAEA